jgi:competence protein ComEA
MDRSGGQDPPMSTSADGPSQRPGGEARESASFALPRLAAPAPPSLVWLVALLAVAGGVWLGAPRRQAAVAPTFVATVTEDHSDGLTVHVSGWVIRPGLVQVPEASRVADAVAAAGGLKPGANLTGLNLAAAVSDGSLIEVPGPDTSAAPIAGGGGDGLIDLNRADAAALEQLPGVGPVLAERIVAYRQEHGPFQAIEDLLSVSGIGERTLESLRPHLRPP